ncbi:MAG: hypothetical protein ACP5QG_07230, partial [candidate division WOR-3 bacterium]
KALLVFGLALAIRFAMSIPFIWKPEMSLPAYGDAIGYHRIALNLVAGHGFSLYPNPPFIPDCFRTPGFPVVLAILYKALGPTPIWGILANDILAAATAFLVYLVLRKRWPRGALLGGLLYAFNPLSLVYCQELMTETLFTFSLIMGLLLLFWPGWEFAWKRRTGTGRPQEQRFSWLIALGGGLCLGLAALTRPVGLYLPALILPFVRKRWHIALGGFAAAVLPWLLRNWITYGFPFFSTVEWVNMAYYNGAAVVSAQRGITLRQADIVIFNKTSEKYGWGVLAEDEDDIWAFEEDPRKWRDLARIGFGYILKNPGLYLSEHLKGTLGLLGPVHPYRLPAVYGHNLFMQGKRLGSGPELFRLLVTKGPTALIGKMFEGLVWWGTGFWIVALFYQLVLYTLALLGFIRNRREPFAWMLALVALYFILIPGPMAVPRMRHPADALLVLLAGMFLWQSRRRIEKIRPRN